MIDGQSARVLITVKASPEPSEQHGDTVCVAGVRLDRGKPEWIRLYPVPFRWMSTAQQFGKYEVIDVDIHRPRDDTRFESYRINGESVSRSVTAVKDAAARGAILDPMIGPTMCELRQGVIADPRAQSLGLVEVREMKGMTVRQHPGWSPEQQRKIDRALEQQPLFGDGPPPRLDAPRFLAQYSYLCMTDTCAGHDQRMLDWELTAFERRWLGRSDELTKEAIKKRFLDELCAPSKRVNFFVGNMAHPTKRRSYSILGVYAPSRHSDYSNALVLDF
ncbi:hypothetical protein [Plantibacter sp. YIM 135249]|uniref:hypothetical protein n=1 Tax=Plantibacter sp. YIM 135249 TaxID=3423918 RepID=UPI003D34DD70